MSLQEILLESTKGLPPEAMKEIVSFALYVRKKALDPQSLEDKGFEEMIRTELSVLSEREKMHLEKKFDTYQTDYPHE